MFVVQLLVPSGGRCKSSMNVTVVVELASRIQDLVQNESGKLLAHGVDPISRVTFIPHLRHSRVFISSLPAWSHDVQVVAYVVPAPISSLLLSRTRIIQVNVQFGPPLTTSFIIFHKFFPNPALEVKFDIQELLLTEKRFDCAN